MTKKRTSLSEVAMLVKPHIATPGTTKKDKEISDETNTRYEAESGGAFIKKIIKNATLQECKVLVQQARVYHRRMTHAWLFDGTGLLSVMMHPDYMKAMREFEQKFESLANQFVKEYPEIIKGERSRLKKMWKPGDYPSVESMRRRFRFKVSIFPIPEKEDFRMNVRDSEINRMVDEMNKEKEEVIKTAIDTSFHRLYKKVKHMVDRIDDEEGRFHDSNVTNIADLCDILKKMNFMQDSKLDEMISEIERSLLSFEPKKIRKDAKVRKEVGKKAKAILKDLEGFVS